MLTAPDAGWTDFQLGSKETRYSLSYLTDIAVEWLDQAIHGLETLEPFSVHGFCEPGRMICTVSYWNCYIIFEGDDRNDKCESVYTVHENMIEFCRKLYSDIDSNLEELREFDSSPEGQRLMSNWDEMSRGYKPFITYPTGERKRSGLTHMFTLDIPELAKYAREHRISLFHLNLFCLHASISAVFNTTDTVICIANGIRSGRYASTVGFLTNGTMSRFKIDQNKLMSQLVLECRNNYFNADKHLKMGYRISPCDFQISYQNYAIPPKMMFDHTKAEVITDMRLSHPISWDIMVMAVFEINDKLMFSGGYDEDIYTPEVLEKMKKYYIAAADCLTNNDKTFEEYAQY